MASGTPKTYAPVCSGTERLVASEEDPVPRGLLTSHYAIAIITAVLSLTLAVFPKLLAVLPGQASLLEQPGHVGEIRSLMVMIFPLSTVYFYSAWKHDLGLLRVSIGSHLCWLLWWIVGCLFRRDGNAALLVVLLLCTLGAAGPSLVMLPDKASILLNFLDTMKPPLTEHHGSIGNVVINQFAVAGILLSCVTAAGAAFGFGFVYAEGISSIGILALVVPFMYTLVLLRISAQMDKAMQGFGVAMLALVVAATFLWGHFGALPIQLIYSYQAFAFLSLGTLAFVMLWQFLVAPEDLSTARMTPGSFCIGVAACMMLEASLLSNCRFLFSKQSQEVAWRVALEQGNTASLLMICGLVCVHAGKEHPSSRLAYYISLLNPWINIWFFAEGVVVAVSGYGSPMKTSWSLGKIVEMYNPNEAINFTYWFAGLQCGVLNSAAMIVIFKLSPSEGWANLSRHGAVLLIFCGWFFGFMVAGVAPGCKAWVVDGGPKYVSAPVFTHVDYTDSLAMHRFDAVLSLVMMAGGLLFSKVMPKETNKIDYIILVAAWMLALVPKIQMFHFEALARMSAS